MIIMTRRASRKNTVMTGFTIVELLIVVVVIAILAAITIVAYNGIQNRAKNSAAQSAAAQASKKVHSHAITNADTYPATLSSIGITDNGDTTYQYRVNNTTNPKQYCVTATTSNISYYVSHTTSSPTAGACDGHGVNGVAAIVNLEPNPSSETTSFNSAGGGVGTKALSTSIKFSGGNSTRFVWSSGSAGVQSSIVTVQPSTTYAASAYVYSESGAMPQFYVGASDYATNVLPMTTLSGTGSWQRASRVYTTAAGQTTLRVWATVNVASTFYTDAIMFTQTPTVQAYADGDSGTWAWTGSAHNSTSTGRPL